MKAVEINWCKDGADVELPKAVVIPYDVEEDDIADYLSDRFGFLVNSFAIDYESELNPNNKAEFAGQVIDIFEDFLEEKGVVIENEEKDDDPDAGDVRIYGSDYGELQSQIEEMLIAWHLLPEV